jgi:Ca-activated chloride channel family protein
MAEMGWLSLGAFWHLAWLLPGLCLLAGWAAWRRRRQLAVLLGEIDARAAEAKTTLSPVRRRIRFVLLLAAILLLVATLARPYWGLRILPFSGSGRDIMIVLDVSRSMLADDLKPSRLEHAKWLLRELISATPGDRYGIVAFAGDAFLQCPLTTDRNSLFLYLNELGPASIPVGGTHVERALAKALDAFAAAEGGHRAVLLVTDGDELSGNARAVIDTFIQRRLPLFAVGLGDPAGNGLIPVLSEDGKTKTLLRDRHGELVVSRLNETALRELAMATPGGLYLRSTVTDSGLNPLKAKIHALVPEQYAGGQRQRPIERFPLPLAAAVTLLLARLAIGERRRTAAAATLAMLALAWSLPLSAQAPQAKAELTAEQPKADLATEMDEPPPADEKETAAPSEETAPSTPPVPAKPLPPWQEYNQALELHEAEKVDEARPRYEQAINTAADRPEVRARAYRNLGVATHHAARQTLAEDPEAALRELAAAEDLYREALRFSADPADVARNQQLLLADRRHAEAILKQQQQLRQQQQDAAKETKEAHDQQQQANADNQPDDQQKPKDSQQKAKEQQQAADQTDQAQKAVEQFQQSADQAKQPQAQQTADQAAKAIQQARDAQRKGDGKTAEKKLAEAMQTLGAGESGEQQQPPKDGGGDGQKQPPGDKPKPPADQGQGEGGDGELPPDDGKPEQAQEAEPNGDIDPQQAAALLDMMANDEKDLRDALRERMRRDAQLKPVDKDW